MDHFPMDNPLQQMDTSILWMQTANCGPSTNFHLYTADSVINFTNIVNNVYWESEQ